MWIDAILHNTEETQNMKGDHFLTMKKICLLKVRQITRILKIKLEEKTGNNSGHKNG